MSKKQSELDALNSKKDELTNAQSANLSEIQRMQKEGKTKSPEYQKLVEKDKKLGSELSASKSATTNKMSEVEAAKKAAFEKQVKEAAAKQSFQAKNAQSNDPTKSFVKSENAQGKHPNIYHSGANAQTNNNLPGFGAAKNQAQENEAKPKDPKPPTQGNENDNGR